MNEPILTAHRSLTLSNPNVENSLEAIEDAINNPTVGAIEIDIQQTKDGVFVLMNYKTLEKVCASWSPEKNKISDYTYDELCQMNFSGNLSEINALIASGAKEFGINSQKVLEWCKSILNKRTKITKLEDILKLDRKGKPLFIEIKAEYKKEQVSEINRYVKSLTDLCKTSRDIYFIGRNVDILMRIKEESESNLILPVIGWTGIENSTLPADGISAAWDALTKNVPGTNKVLGEYMLEKGMTIVVWNILYQMEYDNVKNALHGNIEGTYLIGNFPELIGEYNNSENKL